MIGKRIFISMKFFVLVSTIFLFSQSGCVNPFAPSLFNGEGYLCSDFTKIENIFCAFQNSYSYKDTILYSSILDNDFTFYYRDYENSVDISWLKEEEMKTTFGLFISAQQLNLIWNDVINSNITDTTATIYRSFDLTIKFNPNDIVRIDGYANFTLSRENKTSYWKILRWKDESNF